MPAPQGLGLYPLYWDAEARRHQGSSTGSIWDWRQDRSPTLTVPPLWSRDSSLQRPSPSQRVSVRLPPIGTKPKVMPETSRKKLPKPGPAKLSKSGQNDVNEWLKCAFNNQYLPEATMKKLCEICKEYLMEGGNPRAFAPCRSCSYS